MRYPLLFILSLLTATTGMYAQQRSGYVDVVKIRGSQAKEGTIIRYDFGTSLAITELNGMTSEVPWDRITRVTFRRSGSTVTSRATATVAAPDSVTWVVPRRRWRHRLTATTDFAREQVVTDFGGGFVDEFTTTNLGLGLSYHFVRETRRLSYGVGPGYTILTARRREAVAYFTGLIEYAIGQSRFRPTVGFEGGYALPVGSSDQSIRNRSGGPLLFPSLGAQLRPAEGRWGGLQFQLGYRFTEVGFTVTTPNLEVIDRRVDYRRLVFSIGTRF